MSLIKQTIKTLKEIEAKKLADMYEAADPTNKIKLSSAQKAELVDSIVDSKGCDLSHEDFVDAVGAALEDIPGFETVMMDHPDVKKLVEKLWKTYGLCKKK